MKFIICILTLFFIACSSQNEVPQGTRIIATYRPMSHLIMALGKQQYLVGGHASSNIPLFKELLPHEITLVGSKKIPGAGDIPCNDELTVVIVFSCCLSQFINKTETFIPLGRKIRSKNKPVIF